MFCAQFYTNFTKNQPDKQKLGIFGIGLEFKKDLIKRKCFSTAQNYSEWLLQYFWCCGVIIHTPRQTLNISRVSSLLVMASWAEQKPDFQNGLIKVKREAVKEELLAVWE